MFFDILVANRIANNIIGNRNYNLLKKVRVGKRQKKELDLYALDLKIRRFCKYSLKNKQCLHMSLILYIVLVRYGYKPSFVIGVSIRPFMSHAWVELNDVVINDRKIVKDIYVPVIKIGDDD